LTSGARFAIFAPYTPDPPLPLGMRPGFLFLWPRLAPAGFRSSTARFCRSVAAQVSQLVSGAVRQSPEATWTQPTRRRQFSASFNGLPALNETPADEAMAMRSPVRGFLPSRAGLSFMEYLPNPTMETLSPRASASARASNTTSTAAARAACFVIPASPATRSEIYRSPLFSRTTPRLARKPLPPCPAVIGLPEAPIDPTSSP